MIDLNELIKSGVHFGHQTWRWNPKMKPYIWGSKNGIHLIDVSKTAYQLEKAATFLEDIAASGKSILWLGTKKSAQQAIQVAGEEIKMPYVTHRWVGGTLTNYSQVKKSITKLLYYEDIVGKADHDLRTKKEIGVMQKILARLLKSVGGIRKMTWPVGALVVVDAKKEYTAIREAVSAGIPVVALVDTNTDPSSIDYVIPANDDIPRSIQLIIDYLAKAAARGQARIKETAAKEELALSMFEKSAEHSIDSFVEQEDEAGSAPNAAKRHGAQRRPQKHTVRK